MPEESRLEIEAKVPLEVEDLDSVRSRLREIGARLGTPRLREENTLFDFADGRLEKADSALRVRTFGRACLLTYKGRSREHAFLKLREEIETRVEDPDALIRLLELLGLRKAFHYWKYREIYSLELPLGTVTVTPDEAPDLLGTVPLETPLGTDMGTVPLGTDMGTVPLGTVTVALGTVTVALDETPIGFFAEVEGPEESIRAVVELMGWDPASFIRESYPKLYREHGLGAPETE